MKEYRSKSGGRYIFNEDMQNLQELALSMTEMFKDSGQNFVISGCGITVNQNINDGVTSYSVNVAAGYVFINNKVRKVSAQSFNVSSISTIRIYENTDNGPSIMYADGSTDYQYDDYSVSVVVNNVQQNVQCIIAVRSGTSYAFPNLKSGFFKHYGLLNDDMFINVANTPEFVSKEQNIYTINNYPAEYRLCGNNIIWDEAYLDDNEISAGAIGIVLNEYLNDFLDGKIGAGGFYLMSDIVFGYKLAMPNQTMGSDTFGTFNVRYEPAIHGSNKYYTFITPEVANDIREHLGNGEIGLYIYLLSGQINQSDGSQLIAGEQICFGRCKESNHPDYLYKFYRSKDSVEELYKYLGVVSWNNLSENDKKLWVPDVEQNIFVDIANTNSFTPTKNKVYVIGNDIAQQRIIDKKKINIGDNLDDSEIEAGHVGFIPANKIEEWLSGRPSIGGFYLKSSCIFVFKLAMSGGTGSTGATAGDMITEAIRGIYSPITADEFFEYTLSSDIISQIRNGMGHGEIGLFFDILSGSIDLGDTEQSIYTAEVQYFGLQKDNGCPDTVYKFYKTKSAYIKERTITWANCNSFEKKLWSNLVDGYNGSVTIDGKVLTITNGLITNVANAS